MSETIHHPDQLDLEGSSDVPRRPSRKMPAKPFITRELLAEGGECHGIIRQWILPRGRVLTRPMLAPRLPTTSPDAVTPPHRWPYRWVAVGFAVSPYRSGLTPARGRRLARQLGEERSIHLRIRTSATPPVARELSSKTLVLATGVDQDLADLDSVPPSFWDAPPRSPRWRCIGVNEHAASPLAPVSAAAPPPDDPTCPEASLRHPVRETTDQAAGRCSDRSARLDRSRRSRKTPRRPRSRSGVAEAWVRHGSAVRRGTAVRWSEGSVMPPGRGGGLAHGEMLEI
jgi:hypothetical protein